MEVAPYRLAEQEAALKVPTAEEVAGLDAKIAETVEAVHGGIDKLQAENDSVDAYLDDMGIAPDDTPLSREVAEARKAL